MFCNIIKRNEEIVEQKEYKISLISELEKEIEMLKFQYSDLQEIEKKVDLFIDVCSGNKGDKNERDL